MINIAFIGCGGMGSNFVEPFVAYRKEFRVVAAVDVVESRAADWARRYGLGAEVATDYRQVLDKVDAVFCSLPHQLHAPIGIDCLQAGKHVMMEKPMANSESECLALIDAAKRSGKVFMVAMPIAYHPLVVRMRDLLKRKAYGEIVQVSVWTEQKTVLEKGSWLASAKHLGGGQLFSHGCHYIDLLLRLLGRPIEGMHMGSNHGTPWMEMEGTSNVVMRFEDGPIGYHFGTWGTGGTKLGYAIHAHCSDGMLAADIWEGTLKAYIGGPHISPTSEVKTLFRMGSGFNLQAEIRAFLEAINTGVRSETDGPRALQSLRVIWRLYEAEKLGRMADLRGLGLDEV